MVKTVTTQHAYKNHINGYTSQRRAHTHTVILLVSMYNIYWHFLLGFQTSVLSCLSSLKENIDQHYILLNGLLRSVRKTNETSIVPHDEVPNVPMNSLEILQNFDQKLTTEVPLTKYLVS